LETLAKNKLYEGMFLVDSSLAGSDWDGIMTAIRKILEKVEAEIVSMEKWDDRKLAYDIKGKSRGTYILSYFRVDGGRIKDIEHAVRLSEKIMRVLILSAERLSQEDIEKETPAMKFEKEKEERQENMEVAPEAQADSEVPVEEAVGTEQAEGTQELAAEASEALPITDINPASGASPLVEEITESQPEQSQIEGSGPSDDKELLQP
jgi:small subunit ribosomal protein S6